MAECHPVGLPVGDGGQGARRDGHPRRPAVHPHSARWPTCTCRSGPAPTSRSSAALDQPRPRATSCTSASTSSPTPTRRRSLREDFQDTEDLDGLFSGFDPETRHLRPRRPGSTRAREVAAAAGRPASASTTTATHGGTECEQAGRGESHGSGGAGARRRRRDARRDAAAPALRLPGAQAALRPLHPGDGAARSAASPPEPFAAGRRGGHRQPRPRADDGVRATRSAGPSTPSACSTSAPRRSCSCCSATSGRPGGGIMALRGHASIQGSTDIPTLFNLLPGYLPMPHAHAARRPRRLRRGRRRRRRASGATCAPTPSACSRPSGATPPPRRTTSASTTCRG